MKNLAPIVLFTFNRLSHTQQTITALQKNELANESKLFIYSDGGKDEESWNKVNEVRNYLKTINGFQDITIIKREKNFGLANSIISGVTKIIDKYGKIIVLEDDIVTSPYFLKFMNDALDFYETKEKVWHIGGWSYPINSKNTTNVTFLWRTMNCWGWGTWKNKWIHFQKNTNNLIFSFNKNQIKEFNLDGYHDFWSQILLNKQNKIDTWAIYWYATIFTNNGLCVNPSKSFVQNIGFGEDACHTKGDKPFTEILTNQKEIEFDSNIQENQFFLNKIKYFYLSQSLKNNSQMINFNKTLSTVLFQLDNLKDSNSSYVIYGAGSGAKFIIKYINNQILHLVDMNHHIKSLMGKKVYEISKLKDEKNKIIISVFGREKEILDILINTYNIKIENIVCLK